MLATQNPVDLDYKALSNAGTWFIGRLQTERDKARVLDGLEGAAAATGSSFARQDFDRIISGLGSRVFLLNNTHEDAPVVMTTRWVLSYLPGPLTREQIRTLMAPYKATSMPDPHRQHPPCRYLHLYHQPQLRRLPVRLKRPQAVSVKANATAGLTPTLSPDIPQFYLPIRGRASTGTTLVYQPRHPGGSAGSFADVKIAHQHCPSSTVPDRNIG